LEGRAQRRVERRRKEGKERDVKSSVTKSEAPWRKESHRRGETNQANAGEKKLLRKRGSVPPRKIKPL